MKNIKLLAAWAVFLLSAFVSAAWASTNFSGGDGTENSPYLISSIDDLKAFADRVNNGFNCKTIDYEDVCEREYFKLTADIDFNPQNSWNEAASSNKNNFDPIGYEERLFKGEFDGQGHTIRGLRINNSYYAGLFGALGGGAVVTNVRLANAVIVGNLAAGGIAGLNNGGAISNCKIDSVFVRGNDQAGGIVGLSWSWSGSLSNNLVAHIHISGRYLEENVTGCNLIGMGYGYGAIVGGGDVGPLSKNYYSACTYNGVENATNVGIGGFDEDQCVLSPHDAEDAAVGVFAVTLGEGVSITSSENSACIENGKSVYCMPNVKLSLTADENYLIEEITGVKATIAADGRSASFTMPSEDVSIKTFKIWGNGDGSEGKPYIITKALELDSLAQRVKAGNSYEGVYFKLDADIEYLYTSTTENNYTAIGTEDNPFKGVFNGDGHTISGIRINKPDDDYQGIFGYLGKGAVVKNVTLADAEITARGYTGGIVGYNDRGTVSGCISSVTLVSEEENDINFGGVVGQSDGGTVSNNFAKNVTISFSSSASFYGAVVGFTKASNLSNNFYTACTVNGLENATKVGIGLAYGPPHDVMKEYAAVAVGAVTLDDGISIESPKNPVYTDKNQNKYYAAGSKITLSSTLLDRKTSSYTANGVRIPSTFPMLAENIKVSVKHDDYWGIEGGADGSENKPYIISTVDDLKTLASFINAGENYEGKYFNLGADIEFPHETTWDAVSTRAENNFTAIGTNDNPFKGLFNGKGHTIRGIRIYKPDELRQGLFGHLGEGAVVDGVRLADVIITGSANVGGIAGLNDYGKILNCTVDSVLLKGIRGSVYHFGGIVGFNVDGTVSGCTSSATLVSEGKISGVFGGIVGNNNGTISGCMSSATLVSTYNDNYSYGGIAGYNYGNLNDNAVIGATIPAIKNSGAVVGYDDGSLLNNYYATCTVAGENATNVGVGGDVFPSDVTDHNGAISVSVTAPTAVENLVYDGSSHNLVTAGETNYGTMYYSLDGKAYSAEIPAASGANAYTVYYKVMKEEKWTVFDAQTLEVSIAQAPLTVTAKDKSIIYGDDPANDGVEYSGFVGDETASVLGGKLTYSYDYKKLDNVGKYTITPGGLTSGNYKITFVPGTLNVGKADVSVTAPVANEKLVYSGKAQELVSGGSTDYGTMLYSLDGKDYSAEIPAAADASAYTVYYKVANSDNWNGVDAKTVEVKIAKIDVSVTAPVAKEKLVYSGKAQELVSGGSTDYGTMLYSLDGKDYSAEIPAAMDASAYTVYYKVASSDNWNGVDAKTVEVKIAQAPLTVTAKDKSIVYGDEPANDGVEYSGLVGDETASVLGGKLTYSYDYKKLDKVGKYTITPSGLTSGNYEITYAAGTLTVEIADVSVEAPVAKEKLVYNGKSQELVTAGKTNFGKLLYSLDGKKYSSEIPAATDAKTYTVYYKVEGSDNWNAFEAKKVEVKIAKADVSVEAPVAKEKLVYNGKSQELITAGKTNFGKLLYSLNGEKYSAEIPTATDAKTYTVYYKVEGSDNWNAYEAKKVEVVIAKAEVSVEAPVAKEKLVYNGKSQELVTAGKTNFGKLLYSLDGEKYSAEIPAATDAKTYTVYYKVEGSDNWNAFEAKKVEVVIAKSTAIGRMNTRAGRVTIVGSDRTFDLKGRPVRGSSNARGAYYKK